MRVTCCFLYGLLAAMPLSVAAQTVYVTDNLRLGLHEAEDTSGRPFRMLESGQEMEILSRDRNYANVRLPDATEGWVKNAYLVDEKPAKLIVAEITAERDALIAVLNATRRSRAGRKQDRRGPVADRRTASRKPGICRPERTISRQFAA